MWRTRSVGFTLEEGPPPKGPALVWRTRSVGFTLKEMTKEEAGGPRPRGQFSLKERRVGRIQI